MIARVDRDTVLARLHARLGMSPGHAFWLAVAGLLLAFGAWKLLSWGVVDAVWSAADADACQRTNGACWSVIDARHRIILFGLYPYEEQWRAAAGCLILIGMIVLSCIPRFWSSFGIPGIWLAGIAGFFVVVRGGVFGLPVVSAEKWGGLTLTLFIYASVIGTGVPLATAIALVRRSELTVVRALAGLMVDLTRSLPFLTVVYAAAIVLPIALPQWVNGDRLTYVIFGFAFYFACYESEVLRGGLQSLARGQEEAAMALGLTYWQRMLRIVLPQVFRNTLPPTINEFVTALKETSVIAIVGLFDLTASAHAAYEEGRWNSYYLEVYVFIGVIYFTLTYSLARYGQFLERRLNIHR